MTRTSTRLAAMHALYGCTADKLCRDCYFWHMMSLFCEEAPVGKRSKWAGNWPACGRWVKRG